MPQSADFLNRVPALDEAFIRTVEQQSFVRSASEKKLKDFPLARDEWIELFTSQLISRHLDFTARSLKEKGLSFYTIGSSGHEGNAVLGRYFSIQDMAFLHYRSGAFMVQRSKQVAEIDPIKDHLLALMAAKDDPIAQGRHKVFGSVALNVPPQTSTIASHLPKAVGAAYGTRLGQDLTGGAEDHSVVLCSFGDASLNHSAAQGAINSAQYIAKSNYPLPLIFVCEDNGIGISVPTPQNWVEETISCRPHIHYIKADGLNLAAVWEACIEAEYYARKKHQPVFLHLQTVRLLGHAGSDIEIKYRDEQEIVSAETSDPLLQSARLLIEAGMLTPEKVLDLYQDVRRRVNKTAELLKGAEQLSTAAAVKASLVPKSIQDSVPAIPDTESRQKRFADQFKFLNQPRTLSQLINAGLTDLLLQYPTMVAFGEDVGRKGGVYHVTAELQKRFGHKRVMDTLLDETTILGTALGLACKGLLPVPEIQFLAYTHNAVDQIRGEAATLSFFSSGQFANPMIIRIASMAYQKGFGGHYHNENAIAFLREIPGLIIACPSNGADAVKMLRTLAKEAYCNGRVTILLEPIALYMAKDLHSAGDNLWLHQYPELNEEIAVGELGVVEITGSAGQEQNNNNAVEDENSLTIVSYGNGYYHSLRAAKELADSHGLNCRVVDLRWISPFPEAALFAELQGANRVLLVDECRKTGSYSETILSFIVENCQPLPQVARVTAEDCFISLGHSWQTLLPSKESIVTKALTLFPS